MPETGEVAYCLKPRARMWHIVTVTARTHGVKLTSGAISAVSVATGIASLFITNFNWIIRTAIVLAVIAFVILGARHWVAIERRFNSFGRWISTGRGVTKLIIVIFCTSIGLAALGILSPVSNPGGGTATSSAGHKHAIDLAGMLVGENSTVHSSIWAESLSAYGNDSVALKLTVRNESSYATPQLELQMLGVAGKPWHIMAAVGAVGKLTLLPGSVMEIQQPKLGGCFGGVEVDGSFQVAPTKHAGAEQLGTPEDAAIPAFSTPYGPARPLGSAAILGALATHASVMINAVANISTSASAAMTLEQGPDTVTFARDQQKSFTDLGVAAPGDVLTLDTMIHDVSCRSAMNAIPVMIRAQITPNYQRRSDSITLIASDESESATEVLGTAVINAVSSKMIELTVIPGTTQLFSYPHGQNCQNPIFIKNLLDGIAEGGVSVGDIYGYRPRDVCMGADLTWWVRFKLKVTGVS